MLSLASSDGLVHSRYTVGLTGGSGTESTGSAEAADLVPGLGRSPGEGNGNPL